MPQGIVKRYERNSGFGFIETEEGDLFVHYTALKGRPLNGNRIGMLVGDGLLEWRPGGRIAATARGAPVLNALVAELAT